MSNLEIVTKLSFEGKPAYNANVQAYCERCGWIGVISEIAPALCPKCRMPVKKRCLIRLSELSSRYLNCRILFKGIIEGEGSKKALPVKVRGKCEVCGYEVEFNLLSEDYKEDFKELFFKNKRGIKKHLRKLLSERPKKTCIAKTEHSWKLDFKEWVDYCFVKISDLIMEEEEQKKESTTTSYTGIMLGDTPEVKSCLFDAEPILAPDNTIMLLIYKAIPLETVGEKLKPEEIQEIRNVFQGKTLSELEALLNGIIEPNVKGRSEAKVAAALTALSPRWFKPNGNLIPGCMRVLFFGAPRTGKGMILRWFWRKGLAGHAVGETASRTGLIYSIDPDLKILSWGVLPQHDGRMAVIEGLQGLESEEVRRFREVLAQQRVEVHKVVKGSAWCRTRILADCNPNKPGLSHYLFKCQALLDIKPFCDPIDLTRFDLFIPFGENDVSIDEMYGKINYEVEEETRDAFILLVKWAWSRKAENIRFTDEALDHAKGAFKAISEKYACTNIPVIHNASFWTLLRLATAIATLEFNTPDSENLIVEKKHVEEAASFWKRNLNGLELDKYKRFFGEEGLSQEEAEKIWEKLEKKPELKEFLLEVAKMPGDSYNLAGRLSVSNKTVKRRAAELKTLGVVQRGSLGYCLTKKGVQFLRMYKHSLNHVNVPFVPPVLKNKILNDEGITKTGGQKGQETLHLNFLPHMICEKCGKKGAYSLVRDDGVHYLCDECLRDWEGSL